MWKGAGTSPTDNQYPAAGQLSLSKPTPIPDKNGGLFLETARGRPIGAFEGLVLVKGVKTLKPHLFKSPILFLMALSGGLAQDLPGWRLVWADEFNLPLGSPVDRSKWNVETGGWGWGNSELQLYTESTLNAVHDGRNLVLPRSSSAYPVHAAGTAPAATPRPASTPAASLNSAMGASRPASSFRVGRGSGLRSGCWAATLAR